jgi:hypothetical protein
MTDATAASDAPPSTAPVRRRARHQIATRIPASASARAILAAPGTSPTRVVPCSNRSGPPVATQTTVPTVLSAPQPVAPRNVAT